MARDLGGECGVENRMGELRPSSGPQWDRVGPLFLNALRCDFDATLMMRLLVASTTASAAVLSVVQESAAGKLDRSRRHRQQALAAPVFFLDGRRD
jgi:hypothetical protein